MRVCRRILRRLAKTLLVLFSLVLFVGSAHFIWAWLNASEFWRSWLSRSGVDWEMWSRLFLVFELPIQIQPTIGWLSMKGIGATEQPLYLAVPVGLIVLGIYLIRVSRRVQRC